MAEQSSHPKERFVENIAEELDAPGEWFDYRGPTTSRAVALGFKNFPMSQFGVQKPSLRALARSPSNDYCSER